jgi:uncharacterized protein with NRDE domain
MCLILFAWQAHPHYPLVLAANREEFHQRPTAAAEFWAEQPDLLAGRDLLAGGTWMGINRNGRFAAITNYREPLEPGLKAEQSRGHLVRNYLNSENSALDHAWILQQSAARYQGYNLLLGEGNSLAYISNRLQAPIQVSKGVHGLSNHLLDTDWPKVHTGRSQLESLLKRERLDSEVLMEMLTDRTLTPGTMPSDFENSDLPEQLMRHYFIVSPTYGTRASTVLLIDRSGRVEFVERQFGPQGVVLGTRRFEFNITGQS